MWWYDCLVCVIQTSKDSNNVMFVSHVALPETSSNGVKRKRRKLQPHYEPTASQSLFWCGVGHRATGGTYVQATLS